MATVYLARDLKHDRHVALKVLRPELANSLGPERFQREIRLAARLQHPHILSVHDSGESDGHLWFTMPYVDGESLRSRLDREKQLPIEVALRITREASQALQYAHEHAVIHRDIKPENLLLTADGNTLVADFGIARPLDAGTNTRLTETGLAIGTPTYMSPEQSTGDPDLDARTDIYSLGCVLYEMLAGEPPYIAATAQALIVKRFTEPVPSVRRLRTAVAISMERAVTRALAREPAERWESAAAFAEGLTSLEAAPPKPRSVAVLPFLNLSPDPANEFFADGITEDVIAQLSKIRALKVISRTSVMQFKKRAQSLREIGARLEVATILEGSVRHAGTRVRIVAQLIDVDSDQHLWSETYDRQLTDIFQIQSDVALQIAAALQAELSPDERTRIRREATSDVRAYQLYLQGRHCVNKYSLESIQQGIEYFEQAVAADPEYALAYAGIARGYAELMTGSGLALPSEAMINKAKEAAGRALALDPGLGEAHAVLGLLTFSYEFDWTRAEQEFKMALELSPNSSDIYDYYGWLCGALERHDDALALVKRAKELDPVAHQSDVPAALMRAGRYEEARQAAEQVVAFDRTYPRGHSALGWARLRLGLVAEGLEALETAVKLSPEETMFLGQLGQAYAVTGHPNRAREMLARMKLLERKRPVSPYHLAYVYAGLGEMDNAMDCLERAFEVRAGGVYGIKGSFLFASLRTHPRFKVLLTKMNLG